MGKMDICVRSLLDAPNYPKTSACIPWCACLRGRPTAAPAHARMRQPAPPHRSPPRLRPRRPAAPRPAPRLPRSAASSAPARQDAAAPAPARQAAPARRSPPRPAPVPPPARPALSSAAPRPALCARLLAAPPRPCARRHGGVWSRGERGEKVEREDGAWAWWAMED
nr:vegetative cell wall protein gp1-like [Aegilops tauschii subsp. strangulata]